MEGIIYKFTDSDGKVYIGQTTDEEKRMKQHYDDAKNGSTSRFHIALRDKNFDFKYKVLVRLESDKEEDLKDSMNQLEHFYIIKYKANNPFFGYNGNAGISYKVEEDVVQNTIIEKICNLEKEVELLKQNIKH